MKFQVETMKVPMSLQNMRKFGEQNWKNCWLKSANIGSESWKCLQKKTNSTVKENFLKSFKKFSKKKTIRRKLGKICQKSLS